MHHLITLLFLIAAVLAWVAGIGPFFFGAPLPGSLLLAAAITCEFIFWWRVRHTREHQA